MQRNYDCRVAFCVFRDMGRGEDETITLKKMVPKITKTVNDARKNETVKSTGERSKRITQTSVQEIDISYELQTVEIKRKKGIYVLSAYEIVPEPDGSCKLCNWSEDFFLTGDFILGKCLIDMAPLSE